MADLSGKYGSGGPVISVGVMDFRKEVSFRLEGQFRAAGTALPPGDFFARAEEGEIGLFSNDGQERVRSGEVRLEAGHASSFTLRDVTIGKEFHWERKEEQTFTGCLVLVSRGDGTMAVINEVPLEEYLGSVVSSEMKATAPVEFLKVHSILSRSWLLAALARKQAGKDDNRAAGAAPSAGPGETVRWYEQEEHDLYDVCADDHCQRYQGITKIVSPGARAAVDATRGTVISFGGNVCDARYSKACGGITEVFATAWADKEVPYLVSVADSGTAHGPVVTEEDAVKWILEEPEAYCNFREPAMLAEILPGFDLETKGFFRWRVEYEREELEEILREKSGIDFGTLRAIEPLGRGPSGRVFRLRISGTARTAVVGKELEIRRWLSRSHLYSSAFIVTAEAGAGGEVRKFVFHGAGWGHGVGLCQIGAAAMAARGKRVEEIIAHYFPGTLLRKIY